MSFPTMKIAADCSCGSGKPAADCDCTALASQSTVAMQTLPKPRIPLLQPDVPVDYTSLLHTVWKGDTLDFGIEEGDTGAVVIVKLIAAIKKLSGIDSGVFTVTMPDGSVENGFVNITLKKLGLDRVSNTNDAEKEISQAVNSALEGKASLDGADFTGEVNLPTPAFNDELTRAVNIAFLQAYIDFLKSQGKLIEGVQGGTITSVNSVLPQVDGSLQLLISDLGFSNIEDTADMDKPASNATLTLFQALGIRVVSSVAALANLGPEQTLVLVDGVGFFKYTTTGAPDSVTIFSSNDEGVWSLIRLAPIETVLTEASTILVDGTGGGYRRLTLNGNGLIGAPIGSFVNRTHLVFEIKQGAGSVSGTPYTISWNDLYRFSATLPQPVLTGGAGKMDKITFEYNAAAARWDCIGINKGF